jgi:energy-converting hydrogenase B subunit I
MRGMSKIVRTIACILAVPGIMFGLYTIMHGHLTPGGGFQGGAIISTIFILFIVAYGIKIRKVLSPDFLSLAEGYPGFFGFIRGIFSQLFSQPRKNIWKHCFRD